MSTLNKQFIGEGIIFPFVVNSTGGTDTFTGIELIEASIIQILSFPRGMKFFNEKFGARLDALIEEPSDLITITLLRTFLTDAITKYESRIKLTNIKILPDSNNRTKYNVEVTFRIRNSKVIGSFIYPFYKEIIY